MFLRNPFNYDKDKVSKETAFNTTGVSKTVQSQKGEADINNIVRKFGLTGELPNNYRAPSYGDFSNITDYHSALNAVAEANANFLTVPVEIRKKFANDPEQFVEFCLNPENKDELIKLGLMKKEPAVQGGVPPTEPAAEKVSK